MEYFKPDPDDDWQPNPVREGLDYKPGSVASCINNRGIWVFAHGEGPNKDLTLHVYLRRHGEVEFSGMIERDISHCS